MTADSAEVDEEIVERDASPVTEERLINKPNIKAEVWQYFHCLIGLLSMICVSQKLTCSLR